MVQAIEGGEEAKSNEWREWQSARLSVPMLCKSLSLI